MLIYKHLIRLQVFYLYISRILFFTSVFFIYRYFIYLLAFYLHTSLCSPANRGIAGLYRGNLNNEIADPVLFVSFRLSFVVYLRITLRLCIMQTWWYHFNGSNSLYPLIICLCIYILINNWCSATRSLYPACFTGFYLLLTFTLLQQTKMYFFNKFITP
jgi:hypothetical protein